MHREQESVLVCAEGGPGRPGVHQPVKCAWFYQRRLCDKETPLLLCPTMFSLFRMTCCGVICASFPRYMVVGKEHSPTGLWGGLMSNLAPRGLPASLTKTKEFPWWELVSSKWNSSLKTSIKFFCLFWGHSVEPEISTLNMTPHMQKAVCSELKTKCGVKTGQQLINSSKHVSERCMLA